MAMFGNSWTDIFEEWPAELTSTNPFSKVEDASHLKYSHMEHSQMEDFHMEYSQMEYFHMEEVLGIVVPRPNVEKA